MIKWEYLLIIWLCRNHVKYYGITYYVLPNKKSDPMLNLCENELIKFTFVSFKVAKISLSQYSCEKSKHTYTQHQFIALLCLMKRLKLDYCLFNSIIQLMPEIQLILDLKDVPHYTTL